jgi:hypothetical protein
MPGHDEAPRHNSSGRIRRWVEWANDTLEGQFKRERPGGTGKAE